MTRMTPLLERNEQFASDYTPIELGVPTAQVLIVTCLDHRVDPAIVLGLRPGEAPVIRNAGGRVTSAVIDDIAYLAFLAEQLFGSQLAADALFEVAVVHHTQCGTGFLADPGYRHRAAEATGISESDLAAAAVADPYDTIRAHRGRLPRPPVHPDPARRRPPARLPEALAQGKRLRPRLRHRHRPRHHHPRRPLPP